jgi:hypothetical protein
MSGILHEALSRLVLKSVRHIFISTAVQKETHSCASIAACMSSVLLTAANMATMVKMELGKHYCVLTATILTRKRHNMKLCIHCLSC